MTTLAGPRLRQVALVASDCDKVAAQLQETFGWPDPFHDPGVGTFGLTNAVFAAGDTFVEVVAPMQAETTAGRYLERRGGDSGYMAIFQVPDLTAARRRIDDMGIRVVWKADFDDIAGTHLHPKDMPGAIVSIDWANPPESWRWAGPAWEGGAPPHPAGGVTGLTIEVKEPAAAAQRWAGVLGLDAEDRGDSVTLRLDHAGQVLRFVASGDGRGEAITELELELEEVVEGELEIAGVRFVARRKEPNQ